MAYARFGWDGSDVYVFLDIYGAFCCCCCNLDDNKAKSTFFYSTEELIKHLKAHEEKGHTVPQSTYERLREEKEANDSWIKER